MTSCKLCKNLNKSEEDFRLAFDFVPSELIESVKATKCVVCKLLLDGILRFEEKSWQFSKDVCQVYAQGLTEALGDTLSVEVYFKNDQPKLVLEFYSKQDKEASSDDGINWKAIKSRTSISGHAMSSAAMDWLTTRLKICERQHLCHSHSATTLPKRTLYFQESMNGSIDVRLVESNLHQERYIALSHCWGATQHCILTSDSLPKFKSSIPWQLLPKTFQDSMIFSTKLGVHHIWIDALCIIQDDPTDWEMESAKMADIYQDAYLTLAATGSNNDMGGCFPAGASPAATAAEYELSVRKSLLHPHHVMVRKKVEHWTRPLSKASANAHPLLSRGWAFQERVLSPRVLHFCKEELLWECKNETICECGSLPRFSKMKKDFFVTRTPEESPKASEPQSPKASEPQSPKASEPQCSRPPQGFVARLRLGRIRLGKPVITPAQRAATAASTDNLTIENNGQSMENISRRTTSSVVSPLPVIEGIVPGEHSHLNEEEQGGELVGNTFLRDEAGRWHRVPGEHSHLIEEEQGGKLMGNTLVRDAAENWHRIVEQYSALNLTVETDRLPALSGLAARSSPVLGQYIAGLWGEALVSDLMWRVNLLEIDIDRAGQYISPSWSWASINGLVSYWTERENEVPNPGFYVNAIYELKKRVRLNSFSGKVEVKGTNPYGRICSGTLIVDGFLKRARLRWVTTRTGGIWESMGVKEDPVPLKYNLEINPPDAINSETKRESEDLESDGFQYLNLPFFADYILRKEGPHQIPDNEWLVLLLLHPSICLVLSSDQHQSMTYRRVGIVRQPWEQVSIYGVDWMLGSQFTKGIKII